MARTVLVTGGGTGIGRAVAARFVAAGDSVVITGRRTEVLEKAAAELGATAIRCDHTDPDDLTALVTAIPSTVDVLVNNAGGNTDFAFGDPGSLAEFAEQWRTNLDANLLSAALTTQALDERLASGGAIVHIGSIAADKGAGSYGAAKAGLASWNVGLARELGPRDITTNVVAAGYIQETEFFRDRLTDRRRETLISDTSVKRPGTVDDIAETIYFLASAGARHITGQTINVNGGAWPSR
jgi:NAD(P)-dependent dehydrogenase (short-subunit alcohol dehydrogenase family)